MTKEYYRSNGYFLSQYNIIDTEDPKEEVEEFKSYFYEYIINMSNSQKLKFMGYIGPSATPLPQQQKEPSKQAGPAPYEARK